MGWIKRNLFFVIGGVLALGLLGGAGFYIYRGWDHNTAAFGSLNEVVQNLGSLTSQKPSPGNDKYDNAAIAKEQEKQLRAWINSAVRSFAPIAPIPDGPVTGGTFSGALPKTLGELTREAHGAGVLLPPEFGFSFTAEKTRLTFSPAGLQPLAMQVGEVVAISKILFAAHVNALDGIQRVRVSDDDTAGPPSDYIDERPVTNDLAVITPYVVTFRSFTPELADVLAGFATATNAFIVKSVSVQRADAAGAAMVAVAGGGDMPPGMVRPPGEFAPPPLAAPGVPPAGGKGGLQTVLKEQLLRVMVEVELVKLTPKS